MGIGYGRAARLIDFMAEDGIVGEYKSGSAREVLYTWEEWEALKNGGSDTVEAA
jgi:S-DNA-T family DNA segregation ATPase FtsK/SpoIIIE